MGQVTFGDVRVDNKGGGGSGTTLDSILNKEIEISKVEMELGRDNNPVLYITAVGIEGRIRTGSGVLIKQAAESVKPQTDKGNTVKTTIIKQRSKQNPGKQYYTFA